MGITRDSVIALAADLGYTVTPRRITRDDLYIADEAFFTGTAAEVTPIREVDGRKIGAGRRGPITRKLQNAFFQVVNGRNAKHADWLSPVAKVKPAAAKSRAPAAKPAQKGKR
jgi:branched-chain amino acid aminotransferase